MSLYLGSSYIGDIVITNPIELKNGVLRPDAELIQSFSDDKYLVADEGITRPDYSTTATTLLASSDLTPTITVDQTAYNYSVLVRTVTIPEYSVTSKAKGREEYSIYCALYELFDIAPNSFSALVDSTKITSRATAFASLSALRMLYWSSASAMTLYTATTYGVHQVITAPALSGTTLTCKTPSQYIRGSTTYLSSTYYNAITDVRFQYVIEVYRTPKGNLNLDGWGLTQELTKTLNCAMSSTHNLV